MVGLILAFAPFLLLLLFYRLDKVLMIFFAFLMFNVIVFVNFGVGLSIEYFTSPPSYWQGIPFDASWQQAYVQGWDVATWTPWKMFTVPYLTYLDCWRFLFYMTFFHHKMIGAGPLLCTFVTTCWMLWAHTAPFRFFRSLRQPNMGFKD
jgi:hypothetical protein